MTTATYSGTEEDMRISKEIVAANKELIRCPGIPESIWKAYQAYQEEFPEKVQR